jgi:hypothetical protein
MCGPRIWNGSGCSARDRSSASLSGFFGGTGGSFGDVFAVLKRSSIKNLNRLTSILAGYALREAGIGHTSVSDDWTVHQVALFVHEGRLCVWNTDNLACRMIRAETETCKVILTSADGMIRGKKDL